MAGALIPDVQIPFRMTKGKDLRAGDNPQPHTSTQALPVSGGGVWVLLRVGPQRVGMCRHLEAELCSELGQLWATAS